MIYGNTPASSAAQAGEVLLFFVDRRGKNASCGTFFFGNPWYTVGERHAAHDTADSGGYR